MSTLKMTRTEKKLHVGAEHLWPGSGDDLVVVYRAWTGHEESLWTAATMASLLRQPAERRKCLAELRQRLPRSTRRGPKKDREMAADAALDRLDKRAGGGS